ncbi:intermembrane transport protein PqiB [Thorsellia anophelis]|uniref:Paraquat-inducible protein B n=1 Tax=Thorsellia anophelis DSM 18579 TaxID=1123402 RepID=A0A1I0AQ93_9GAMM|nr:intermembrane transport protein PqiB [Thorsellia anophelis]SES95619.1 paraquat-inducible protein B [Thorsellia anophelis DSM 18579]
MSKTKKTILSNDLTPTNNLDSNVSGDETLEFAQVNNVKRYWSPVWIVPIICVLIGLWIVYKHYSSLGPQVTLITATADGIEAGKTRIKTRNVDVGLVETVELSKDLSQVIVTARLSSGTESFLRSDSAFWVVRPQIDKSGISGLGTILSGPFIELLPGVSETSKDEFTLLDAPPIAAPDAKGLRIFLESERYGQLSAGDPVLFRGFQVGTVETSVFNQESRTMKYQLFINSPLDALITENVRFWKDSGINVDLSAQGIRVEMGSITTLFSGGVSFDIPKGWERGNKVNNNAVFKLYDNSNSIQEQEFKEYEPYVILVAESIRGLDAGAPVEFRGIRLGTVIESPMQIQEENILGNDNLLIPILIHIEPARFTQLLGSQFNVVEQFERGEIKGLRASLKTANLLTGALYVDLDFYPNEAPFQGAQKFGGLAVLPTVSGGIAQIQQKVMTALDKVNSLPIEPLLNETTTTIVTGRDTLIALNDTLEGINKILSNQSTQQLPTNIQATLVELNATLEGLQPGSESYTHAVRTLQRLEQTLRELQPLLQTLNQKSNALIFQAPSAEDPIPKAFEE